MSSDLKERFSIGGGLTDRLMYYSIWSMIILFLLGFIGVGGRVAVVLSYAIGYPTLIWLLVMMVYCLSRVIKMPSSQEKPLWFIGILFTPYFCVPWYYFKYVSRRYKQY